MLLNLEREKTRIDPRVKRTRQLIVQAFTELLNEKSFETITIQDIADRATINRVTFYAHFPDKYALMEYTIRTGFQERLHSQLPDGAPYNPDNLALLTATVGEFLSETAHHCPPPREQMEPLMEKQIKAELYEIILRWLEDLPSGRLKGSPTAEQAATVTSWAIYGAATQWLQERQARSSAEYVRQVLPLILCGLEQSIV